jgi:hypothetical protein
MEADAEPVDGVHQRNGIGQIGHALVAEGGMGGLPDASGAWVSGSRVSASAQARAARSWSVKKGASC